VAARFVVEWREDRTVSCLRSRFVDSSLDCRSATPARLAWSRIAVGMLAEAASRSRGRRTPGRREGEVAFAGAVRRERSRMKPRSTSVLHTDPRGRSPRRRGRARRAHAAASTVGWRMRTQAPSARRRLTIASNRCRRAGRAAARRRGLRHLPLHLRAFVLCRGVAGQIRQLLRVYGQGSGDRGP